MQHSATLNTSQDTQPRKHGRGTAGKPSAPQLRYLAHGIGQPGGKLPLFDAQGQEISTQTIRSCIDRGWAEPWFDNPVNPGWIVCRLTKTGRQAVNAWSGRQSRH